QHVDMARELYATEEVFRRELDGCCELLRGLLARDLRELLFPAEESRAAAERELVETRYAQPALFAVEYALARLWMSWGVVPAAMLGHSLGEYVAACLAGVFSLADALALVAARGELMQTRPTGAMLAVEMPEAELISHLGPDLELAAVNAAALTVAAGPEPAIAALAARLEGRGVTCRRLHSSHAFHTAVMEPILGRFAERVARVERRPPAIPYLSNVTGDWITADQAVDPGYCAEHLRRTVRFAAGLDRLLAKPDLLLLEVGPGRSLASVIRAQGGAEAAARTVCSLRHPKDRIADSQVLLAAFGRIWLAGVEVDVRGPHAAEQRRRVALPTYPFERQRFWVEPASRPASDRGGAAPDWAQRLAVAMERGEEQVVFYDFRGRRWVCAVEPEKGAGAPQLASPVSVPRAAVPGHRRPSLRSAYVAPRSDLEARIADIFGALVGVADVGVDDSFFELGGDSLLATRVVSRLRAELEVDLHLRDLFEAPTAASLAERLGRAHSAAGATVPAIGRAPRDADLPLSFAQERLWFLAWLEPESVAYNLPLALRWVGALSLPALELSLREVVRRHEGLRTLFPEVEGRPTLRICEPGPFLLPLVDLSGLLAGREEALRIAIAEARTPFSLQEGPLWRSRLLRLASGEHLLLFNLHHIVSDGWSQGVLLREVSELYRAFAAAAPSPLAELPIQYADYAAWQRHLLAGELLERQLAYWRGQLGGGLAPLEIPIDHPRPRVETFRGARQPAVLGPRLTAAVGALGLRHGATLFMTLLAGFGLLLGRFCRQDDIPIGSPIAGRTQAELEGLIGLFVNTLVLRVDLACESFAALLGRVKEMTLAAYAHQDLPFERVVQALQPERDLSRSPLFQVFFVLQNTPTVSIRPGDLAIEPVETYPGVARFDLQLALTELDAGLTGYLEFKSELIDRTTATRWLGQLTNLLAAVAADPVRPLTSVSLLSAAEEHHLLREWNDTVVEIDLSATLHRRIEAQAAQTPERLAVVAAGEALTYGALDAWADRLADFLRQLGVVPDMPVAICAERSPELIIGLLAILKAGGAYVPLDPSYPQERLVYMLQDATAGVARPVLLTQEPLGERFSTAARGVTIVRLDIGELSRLAQRGSARMADPSPD
ncbi:MAG TPA: condensation domain-containing protein, partial [Thermoanaerobaculia bacterium]|nr:condensation domain-containing protein [Thermoanaerobaculia bacterium]